MIREMIAQLEGTVSFRGGGFLIVRDNSLGYKVFTPRSVFVKAKEGAHLLLWTHLAVREDAMDLYGFSTREDVDFFELLITVSGIGPKSALAIINLAPVQALARAIAAGDTTHLTKVSGIGKKSAAKIVVELKDKLASIYTDQGKTDLKDEEEALLALKTLGYQTAEARDALREAVRLQEKTKGAHAKLNDIIREALKILSQRR